MDQRDVLAGAEGYRALWNQRRMLAASSGIHVARVQHLLNRYGTCAQQLLGMLHADPRPAAPLPGADDHLAVEARYAVTHEGALHQARVAAERVPQTKPDDDSAEAARLEAPDIAGMS